MDPMNQTSSPRELLVTLRRADGRLHAQIEGQLREAVRAGRLAAGERLPSTRALAAELGVSRGVVVQAYGQLAAEGYLAVSPVATPGCAPRSPPTSAASAASRRRPSGSWSAAASPRRSRSSAACSGSAEPGGSRSRTR